MELTRGRIRGVAAVAALTMAAIYYLIGLRVLDIGGTTTGQPVDVAAFGGAAGTAFLVLAALLAFTDLRLVWIAATVFQVLVYVMYVAVSGSRSPAFEIWGITLRIIQVPLLLGLFWLSATPTHPRHAATTGH